MLDVEEEEEQDVVCAICREEGQKEGLGLVF